MTQRRNLAGYGMPPIEWRHVRDTMSADITQAPDSGGPDRRTAWLTTINPDGAPHVTREIRNIVTDPRCVVSVATHPFDLVIEGSAVRVTDVATLQAVGPATIFAFGTAKPHGATKFDIGASD